ISIAISECHTPMRLEDIRLRDAARNGDAKACNEIAVRLFSGSNGFGRNFKLGLAYLQHALLKKVPSAILLAGEAVPLDILMAQGCRDTLAEAARLGSSKSRLKLGIWMMLRRDERGEGARWIKLSEGGTRKWDAVTFDDPGELVTLLKSIASCDLVDRSEVPLSGALCALKDLSIHDACCCLRAGAQLGAERERFAELVFLTVQLAASRGADLDLPVDLIESSLWSRAEQGEVEAQYALGRALAGSAYGHLKWDQLARRVDVRSSAALLLRAAHGGKREAWLDLAEMAPGYTTSCGNREMARFFLERAAESGLVEAQRKLGTALLKDATSVERAEVGVYWLSQAAGKGDTVADELLRTLVLPLPELSAEYENTVIERIRAISPDLGARIALARALHLTRREAMTFNAKQNIRPWG